MNEVVWTPDEATIEHANATRLVRRVGVARLRRAGPALGRTSPSGSGRSAIDDLGLEFSRPWDRRARRLARPGVDDLVPRRHDQHRPQLRPPLGRAAPRRPRGGRARRGRLAKRAHVRRALARGDAARRGAGRARRRSRRPRRALPADVARGRGRLARVRAHRRDPGADLLRLRRAGGRAAARVERGEGRDHAAGVDAPRPDRADARDPRGGDSRAGVRSSGRARRRVELDGRPGAAAPARGRLGEPRTS